MYAWDQLIALTASWLALCSPAITNHVSNPGQAPAVIVSQQVVPVAAFKSVELRNGGRVTLRQGPSQRVTLLSNDPTCVRITVERGDRLVINHTSKCASEERLQVEVIATDLTAVAVSNGGTLQSLGSFTNQRELAVAVAEGGMLDIRSMSVQNVTAAVQSGGRIFTKPQHSLVAAVAHGGAITYWGSVQVTQSVSQGGVVVQGDPADADKPLVDSDYQRKFVPTVPPEKPVSSVPQ